MSDDQARRRHDDLHALRIDRGATRPRSSLLRLALGVVVLAVAVGGAFVAYRRTLGRTETVTVAYASRLEAGASVETVVLTGSGYIVTAAKYISLGVRVPGRIEAYLVDEGMRVESGQALVRLDPREYQERLNQADAGLRLARANIELYRKELARLQELRRQEFTAVSEVDIKQNQLRVAEAEAARYEALIAQAKLDLDDTVLRAPRSGVVLEKFKEVGEIAVPGGFAGSGDLIRIADLTEMRAELDVNEADLSKVHLGQSAEVIPDAFPDRKYAATVVKMYPQINRQKGTLKVQVRILQPDDFLRPDMSGRITFRDKPTAPSDGTAAVRIPRAALRSDSTGPFAWIVTQGRLRRQALRGTTESGDQVLVAGGLTGGEAVVISDATGFSEGMAVTTGSRPE